MGSYSGLFVAIEGIDGSGKSTQLSLITKKLTALGYKVHPTSEPSSGRLGPILREYLSDPSSRSEVDALLFAADRVEHYYGEILPKLSDGYIVITDRYKASSIIYQGLGNLSEEWIKKINDKVPDPDLTLYLDLSADVALERVSGERNHLEKFENIELLSKLLARYKALDIENKVLIDATDSIPEVTESIVSKIVQKFDN